MTPLTDRERDLIDFAGKTYLSSGQRDADIRDLFRMSPLRYMQLVNGLLDRPEALAYAPTTINRLRRLRDLRRHKRSIRSLQDST